MAPGSRPPRGSAPSALSCFCFGVSRRLGVSAVKLWLRLCRAVTSATSPWGRRSACKRAGRFFFCFLRVSVPPWWTNKTAVIHFPDFSPRLGVSAVNILLVAALPRCGTTGRHSPSGNSPQPRSTAMICPAFLPVLPASYHVFCPRRTSGKVRRRIPTYIPKLRLRTNSRSRRRRSE